MKKQLLISLSTLLISMVAFATVPAGAIDGVYYISKTEKVYFSQGNLVHEGDVWSFTDKQSDLPGTEGQFAWGTSGYGDPSSIPQDKGIRATGFSDDAEYANYDWGVYNAISNGGNTIGQWRTLTGEEWLFLKEHYSSTHTLIDGTPGWKIMSDDGEHFLFLPDGDYWASTSGSDYSFGLYTAEACRLTETNRELLGNANRTDLKMVRLVYVTTDHAMITVSDRHNNSTLLTKYKQGGDDAMSGMSIDVHVVRSLTPNMSNTLTLPFDVSKEELSALCGNDFVLLKLNTIQTGFIDVKAREFNVNMVAANSIQAGVPYLITPTQDVTDMYFANRIIKVASNEECIVGAPTDLVQLCGLLDGIHLEAGNKNYLFLYPNDVLVWPADGDAGSMYSLRAYFKINPFSQMSLQQFAPRMRITQYMLQTSQEDIKALQLVNHKYLRDGKLFIENNQVLFNAQGQRIK